MKKISNLLKIFLTLIVILSIAVLSGCNNGEPENTPADTGVENPGNVSGDDEIIMTVNGYSIRESIYKIMLYDAAISLQQENEPDENLSDEEYSEWLLNFFFNELNGRMPFNIARDNVIDDIKKYVYLMQEVERTGIKLDDGERADMETGIIISLGDEYNPENPDEYFLYKYEVTKQQYMDYIFSLELIDRYIEEQSVKQEISEEKIDEYMELYGNYYSVYTIRSIFLSVSDESELATKMPIAEDLLKRIKDGENMINLVNEFSQDGGNTDGIFTVSNSENEYPYQILDWVYFSAEGDSGIVTAEDGIYILRCEDIAIADNAEEEIKRIIGTEIIQENIQNVFEDSKYNPNINEELYNSYKKLPGDLMPEEDAVG